MCCYYVAVTAQIGLVTKTLLPMKPIMYSLWSLKTRAYWSLIKFIKMIINLNMIFWAPFFYEDTYFSDISSYSDRISWTPSKKKKVRRERVSGLHSKLQFLRAGKSKVAVSSCNTSHYMSCLIIFTIKDKEKLKCICRFTCLLVFKFSSHIQFRTLCLGNGVTYIGLGLPIEVNLIETVSHRHTHRHTQCRQPITEKLFQSDSRLCHVNN